MKLLADENLRRDVVDWLRSAGHDVAWIAEDSPGCFDEEIVYRANREGRILITADLDFGELIILHNLQVPGVLILRMGTIKPKEILKILQDNWPKIKAVLTNQIVIMTPRKVRGRPIHNR